MSSLTIAVATLSHELSDTIKRVDRLVLPERVSVLIVSQREDEDRCYQISSKVRLAKSKSSGLSISRNLAIEKCESDWIWFQDSDIELVRDSLEIIMSYIDLGCFDMLLGQVNSLENPDNSFKDYSRYSVSTKLLCFRISSIEMIARVRFLRDANVEFDTNLGLGTDFPSCEENLFFYSVVCREKGRLGIINTPICLHTTVIEKRNINFAARYKARGYMLGKIPATLGWVVATWWLVRPAKDEVRRYRRVVNLVAGWWHAKFGGGRAVR